MQNDQPLISIVTVVFNGVDTVERTINSVLNQTYKNIEYIVIDGVSIDGTLDIIDKYKTHISKFVSEKDRGIADAMNKGINLATGKFIGLLNADDWFEKGTVEKIVKLAVCHPEAVIHGDMRIYINASTYYVEKAPVIPNFKKGMELNHSTVFVPAMLYKKYGCFNIDYQIIFDWELMIRLHLAGINFIKINEVLSNFSAGGVSTVRSKHLIQEMHQVRKKYALYKMIDVYYIVNIIRSVFFGSNIIKISQWIRLIKYKLSRMVGTFIL